MAKGILSKSMVYNYALNPYVGCQHGCRYCYARFMKRFSGHSEPWGEFVDVKINAVEVLRKELATKKRGKVWVSGVCDPYQRVEERYSLTRNCLRLLLEADWPVVVQTKSSLVIRDIDIFQGASALEVGLSIGTCDDSVRQIFEPKAPKIGERLQALETLKKHDIRTFVMIAPILPGAERLPQALEGLVDFVLIDRLNYHYADRTYKRHGMEWAMGEKFFLDVKRLLWDGFSKAGIPTNLLF